jgi:hypothetical protein
MTIGGTRYFMGFHAKENWIGCVADHNMLKSTAAPRARQESTITA